MKCMLTIANKSNSEEFINFAYQSGVRDFRVNMAYEEDAMFAIGRLCNLPNDIRVFIDFPAEKQRVQLINNSAEREFYAGEEVVLSVLNNAKNYITNTVSMMHKISPKSRISFADGNVIGEVLCKKQEEFIIKILKGGIIRNNAGCCFIGEKVPSPSITKEYCNSILQSKPLLQHYAFATWVILSFVSNPDSIKDFVTEMHNRSINVMAKVETPEAIKNMCKISFYSDGILVGRGDLKNLSGEAYTEIYQQGLTSFAKIPSTKYKGIGTFFLLNYAMTKQLYENEIKDLLEPKRYGSDFIMFSKEVVNSCYPHETVQLANKLLRAEN